MKVKIGPYVNWIGPYQIAQAILFFIPKVKDEYGLPHIDPRVHKFGEWLAHGSIEDEKKIWRMSSERPKTWLYKFCDWVQSKRERTIKVHIDRWDTWSMDHTLAYIILPMLKDLFIKKHGSAFVDLEDVPEELRYTETEHYDSQLTFDFYEDSGVAKMDCDVHRRWNWVMNEMIWAFEQKLIDDWEDQYRTGESDYYFERVEGTDSSEMKNGPNHTFKIDYEGMKAHQARMKNGFRLFGKYYEGLWD